MAPYPRESRSRSTSSDARFDNAFHLALKTTTAEAFGPNETVEYSKYAVLEGVPTQAYLRSINDFEASSNWATNWLTIQGALSGLPSNQRERISDWFYNQFKAHPSQLVHRRHISSDGLITKTFLIKFHSLGTSLQALENDGQLSMPWLQFYLWRVGCKSVEFTKERSDLGNRKLEFGRQILMDIFARSSSKAADPILIRAYHAGGMLRDEERDKQAQLERKRKASVLTVPFSTGDSEDEFKV